MAVMGGMSQRFSPMRPAGAYGAQMAGGGMAGKPLAGRPGMMPGMMPGTMPGMMPGTMPGAMAGGRPPIPAGAMPGVMASSTPGGMPAAPPVTNERNLDQQVGRFQGYAREGVNAIGQQLSGDFSRSVGSMMGNLNGIGALRSGQAVTGTQDIMREYGDRVGQAASQATMGAIGMGQEQASLAEERHYRSQADKRGRKAGFAGAVGGVLGAGLGSIGGPIGSAIGGKIGNMIFKAPGA